MADSKSGKTTTSSSKGGTKTATKRATNQGAGKGPSVKKPKTGGGKKP
jgi:hypothetical protein